MDLLATSLFNVEGSKFYNIIQLSNTDTCQSLDCYPDISLYSTVLTFTLCLSQYYSTALRIIPLKFDC